MNETNQNNENNEDTEVVPTFDELAESGSIFISAKNYGKGKKVTFTFVSIDTDSGKNGMQKSEKFGTWQCIYNVTKDGEQKKYGMPGKIAKTLRDEYGIKDYKDACGKTITMLVVKTSSGQHTFEIVDIKATGQAQVQKNGGQGQAQGNGVEGSL